MEMKKLQNQKGFTLVEIAIVLVIIGLLLGGVLKGQELIENSKIKSVIQDFDGTTAAYYSYKDRTGNVAGDADGDAKIDDNASFWQDLRAEGFVTGDASASTGPVHALDGVFQAYPGAATISTTTLASLFTKNYICATNIDGAVAENIDNNLDDGDSTSGVIRADGGYTAGAVNELCKQL